MSSTQIKAAFSFFFMVMSPERRPTACEPTPLGFHSRIIFSPLEQSIAPCGAPNGAEQASVQTFPLFQKLPSWQNTQRFVQPGVQRSQTREDGEVITLDQTGELMFSRLLKCHKIRWSLRIVHLVTILMPTFITI